MKTILVTGATGFLGKHLVERLLATEPEAELRLLCRREPAAFENARVKPVIGDVTKADDVAAAAAGAAEVYHAAGVVERQPAEPATLYQTHVEGTRNVCEAMLAHSVSKGVFVSTSGVMAVSEEPTPLDETAPYAHELVSRWPYYLSKIYAEKLALGYVRESQLPIVIVNPSLLMGPGDDRRSSTRDIELFLEGRIPVIPTGGLNMVDARDAAAGMTAAMARGTPGERYLLAGENMSFHEWMRRVAKLSGAQTPKLMVPESLSLAGARLLRGILPLAGKRFELDDESIRMSSLYWYCDSTKARRELGFTNRPVDETLRDTIAYLRGSRRPAAAS